LLFIKEIEYLDDDYIVKTNQNRTKPGNGYNIAYSESADTNRKHVLFIHGLGASSLGEIFQMYYQNIFTQ
jgi:hypothetical protein